MNNTMKKIDKSEIIAKFLKQANRQPIFFALVISEVQPWYFCKYAKTIAKNGLEKSKTHLFTDAKKLAYFSYDNRYLLDSYKQMLEDDTEANINPRKCKNALKYWHHIGSLEIRKCCFDFNLFCKSYNMYDND